MKKVVLVGIMFLMFMGVVSASSINGEYKGNPVVKLMIDGKEVAADDVPAMIYDNRTVVPIYLLKKMGATVTWDLDNYSADVKFPKSTSDLSNKPQPTSNSDIVNDAKLANMFKLSQDLADRLRDYSNYLSLYFTGYNTHVSNPITDSELINYFSPIIDNYNYLSNKYNSIKSELTNMDLTDLRSAIQNEFDAIDKYKMANTDVMTWKSYYVSNNFNQAQSYFDNYLTESSAGNKLSNKAHSISSSGYDTYILKIIN